MQTKVTARHFDLTPEIRTRAEAEIDSLSRYFDNIISVELTLDMERHRRIAEVKAKVYKEVLTGTADTDDIYNSISQAVEKVKGQLIKYKGKLKGKRPEEITELTASKTKPHTNPEDLDI